ncbi:hypothetical protein CALCODRAFT_486522 [Calocera cornea HHB12733]|uniref:Uncharacterized protein n=1 Tax=Calocera cornea HHB12733 TaxID=1353952 RepID=A0A165DNY2_9BASI|nr:hypothetical protein CALCODRAFT_486522 [Calocera cornea HHB12733]
MSSPSLDGKSAKEKASEALERHMDLHYGTIDEHTLNDNDPLTVKALSAEVTLHVGSSKVDLTLDTDHDKLSCTGIGKSTIDAHNTEIMTNRGLTFYCNDWSDLTVPQRALSDYTFSIEKAPKDTLLVKFYATSKAHLSNVPKEVGWLVMTLGIHYMYELDIQGECKWYEKKSET